MRILRLALGTLSAFVALLLLYGWAGLVGGAIPVNAGWQETPGGIPIGIETNGIHTGIVLPAAGFGHDWRDLVRAEHLPDQRFAGRWLSFGWGERGFYLDTPTWADVRPSTIVAAALGSDQTLVHVDHVAVLEPAPWRRVVRISQSEYDAIIAAIRARFRLDEAGHAVPIPGYGPADIFYEANGRYTAFNTCNSWVGRVLAGAGLPGGLWTPFSWSVMQHALPRRSWRVRPGHVSAPNDLRDSG